MNQYFKLLFIIISAMIVGASVFFSNRLAHNMTVEEKQRIELWAEANKKLLEAEPNADVDMIWKILESNSSIPVIWVGDGGEIQARNVREPEQNKVQFYKKYIAKLHERNRFFVINLENEKQYVYFDDSLLIKQLQYFPFVQLGVIIVFLLVAFFAFSASQKSEQNKVWVGLSKETAHQLGTPISSLLAWVEILKSKYPTENLIPEMNKDVSRLRIIAERFSKIGSKTELDEVALSQVLNNAIHYMKSRTSSKVTIKTNYQIADDAKVKLNVHLFEWVIENLYKNAVDAMDGEGNIHIRVSEHSDHYTIDVKDTGKGIPSSKFKTVFNPGYTTKKRGWGLGLSLVKRIVEDYHHGKIFVKQSEMDKGTTFRILLKK